MMKLAVLMGIAHNLADSVASGIGFMIGVHEMDILGEADALPEGFIEVDFLRGVASRGTPSPDLARAIRLYSEEALPRLCESHGAIRADFRQLKVRFWRPRLLGRFEVAVEDQRGRRATAEYEGSPAKRVKVLDPLGRMRPK